jgi:hypothetical protein
MTINFNNIFDDVIPMNQFRLKCRFLNEQYPGLPETHLQQLKPLGKKGSGFLWDYTMQSNLHANTPFKKDFFQKIDKASIRDGKQKEFQKWLYDRDLPFEKPVFLSWRPTEAMIVPWKLLVKYFDYFNDCTPGDLTVIDQSLNWALFFYQENEVYFGTKSCFNPVEQRNNVA